ncbi:MAG TPA: DnaJ domain-containing protein [Ktedonobacterales bacterium]|nr:DnaJ domain-containing protein [Ktedonobacterales bacterium]
MPPEFSGFLDYYVLLGVAPSATPEEIRQAYRLRARELHPDARPDDPTAADRFKAVAEAYRVLSSPEARQAYDARLRAAAADATHHRQRAEPRVEPTLTLRVTPGSAGIGRLREPTRFYLLGELLPASAARSWSAPLDLAVLVDRSSSMRGAKIAEAKRAVKPLFSQLGADDQLTLLLFDDRTETLLDGESPVGALGAEMALDAASPRGATQLAPALDSAIRRLEQGVTAGRLAALLLITDGRTYGDEERCLELAERARLLGVPIISYGLGLEWNRELLDRIAAISGGSCVFVDEPAQLSDLLREAVERLRATLAANVRLSLAPATGVSVLRASVIAPEIADVYDASNAANASDGRRQPGESVTVNPGPLTARPALESVVALWELLLDPAALTPDDTGYIALGVVSADWSLGVESASFAGRLSQPARAPRLPVDGLGPLEPETRLALELLTAYRLHTQADQLATAGATAEAATALNTSALRLRSAGDGRLADEAQRAATSLVASLSEGMTATLRAKYAIRNLNVFHQLRHAMRTRLPSEAP